MLAKYKSSRLITFEARENISPDQSKMNENPGRFENPNPEYYKALFSTKKVASTASIHAPTQVQHGHPHTTVAPSKAEEPKPAGADAGDRSPREHPETSNLYHLAADITASERTEGVPVAPTLTNSDEPSHDSSQRARQGSSPGSTPPSDVPFDEKHSFGFHLSSRILLVNAIKTIGNRLLSTVTPQRQGRIDVTNTSPPAILFVDRAMR